MCSAQQCSGRIVHILDCIACGHLLLHLSSGLSFSGSMLPVFFPGHQDASRVCASGFARSELRRRGSPFAGLQISAEPLRRGGPGPHPSVQHLQRGLQVSCRRESHDEVNKNTRKPRKLKQRREGLAHTDCQRATCCGHSCPVLRVCS